MLVFYERMLCFEVQWDRMDEVFDATRQAVLNLNKAPRWFDWPDGTELPEGPPAERLAAIKRLLEADLELVRKALDPEENPDDALRLMHESSAILVAFELNFHQPENPLYIALERLTGAGILTSEKSIYGEEMCIGAAPPPQRLPARARSQGQGGEKP